MARFTPLKTTTVRTLARLGMALAVAAAFAGAAAPASAADKGKVLIVMSSAHQLELKDGKKYNTGYYLDELALPLRKLLDAGYTPVFASPNGTAPSYDQVSHDKMFFEGSEEKLAAAVKLVNSEQGPLHPKKLSAVLAEGTKNYVGIFIPGGHAPMQDLSQDKDLGKILLTFHDTQRPTGIICHGPTALLSTLSDPVAFRQALIAGDIQSTGKLAAGWPYAGYHLTVFSSAEEKFIEGPKGQLGGFVQFHAADALAEAGAHVERVAAFHPNVVEDREVVSGEQPMSSDVFGDAFVAKLNRYKVR
ncbi:type 1 glutamine amidotransferase domain-containing protein [Janthinobacterium agaricidamnosum]|uniref:DJ-1/PfpI family protein n=1 Tax=Janthinobacterium agaricidamnosum NBRC 102515 = DSM 9628 TaxID=1349767 RepID=W0VBW4_9BURK|nr:type 1 glutamine amidotransferase domain-containing protein [Janthinobacterium agaricidamnosum]CDG84848.1 DJ-1/PfpI family protein [Janthinobacterium agaricidamnosum NBRC 102515 = DSM 9628]